MFVFNEETRTYWFSAASMEGGTEFRLVGQLMGLAIFNSVILDAHFPHCLYMKLLGKKPGFSVSSTRFRPGLTLNAEGCDTLCARSQPPLQQNPPLVFVAGISLDRGDS